MGRTHDFLFQVPDDVPSCIAKGILFTVGECLYEASLLFLAFQRKVMLNQALKKCVCEILEHGGRWLSLECFNKKSGPQTFQLLWALNFMKPPLHILFSALPVILGSKHSSRLTKRLFKKASVFSRFLGDVSHTWNCSPLLWAVTAIREGGPKLLSATNFATASNSRLYTWRVATLLVRSSYTRVEILFNAQRAVYYVCLSA